MHCLEVTATIFLQAASVFYLYLSPLMIFYQELSLSSYPCFLEVSVSPVGHHCSSHYDLEDPGTKWSVTLSPDFSDALSKCSKTVYLVL